MGIWVNAMKFILPGIGKHWMAEEHRGVQGEKLFKNYYRLHKKGKFFGVCFFLYFVRHVFRFVFNNGEDRRSVNN